MYTSGFRRFKEKYLAKGSFKAHAFTVMSGMIIVNAIPVLTGPMLARLYTPSDFGTYAVCTALIAIIATIGCARYEMAIMLPKDDADSINLVVISIFFSSILFLVILLVSYTSGKFISRLLANPEIARWLYAVAISVILTNVFQAISHWLIRKKHFKALSISRVLRSGVSAATQLGMGVFHYGVLGLILGNIAGLITAVLIRLKEFFQEIRSHKRSVLALKKMMMLAARYKDFPKYDMAGSMINLLAMYFPVILFSSFFGSMVTGHYALTQRMLLVPVSLISLSIGDVYKQRASSDYLAQGSCRAIFMKTFKSLCLLAVLPFLVLLFIGPQLFSFIFGDRWRMAGEYAQIMSVLLFFKLTISPLYFTLYVANKQNYRLVWSVLLFVFTTTAFFVGVYFKSPKISVLCFSIAYSMMYILLFFLGYKFSKK